MSKLDQLRAMRENRFAAEGTYASFRPVTQRVTPVTKAVTPLHAIAGEPCPLCGHRIPKKQTPAEKQKAYRARRKGNG